MKKTSIIFCLSLLALSTAVSAVARKPIRIFSGNKSASTTVVRPNNQEAVYESIRKQYSSGRISADSVISLARYHKVWSPVLAERCLVLVPENNSERLLELGILYTFSPEFSKKTAEGIRLLEKAAAEGESEANCYLGLYYFNHKDYKKAASCLESGTPMKNGIGYTALGSMYTSGAGVKEDLVKARENFRQASVKGNPRGMALYGFNLRANGGGRINYPDSFFWLYNAGDLGDDAARVALFLPRRGEKRSDSEVGRDAQTALQMIELAQSGKKIQNEPIYKEGFLASLKDREKEAERGDDWARYYLGSMNYNGDFLNQNYAQAIRYYEPISRNGKLPSIVLAQVNNRLAEMYRDGKGSKADKDKAMRYTRKAAQCGSLSAYKSVEHITE